ncbi:CaiB/BaiF CoA-transferase family protein [Rhodococcus erythropolis]|uniref:CaiB/BaiF CoA transferase family protein n=1 Tax=Rhodococcus erythropolis TaxID=1833 RepID=UPI0029497FFA|nr:CaiB/BaiF CoA-transferase family protein [Rhodococcus erythropolis]MDV6212759.1 CaiB/BaiF CoA-transferase family protein [Rhodococcus erythropolis]
MSALPLDDIVVVAIEQAVAVPFATRQLADLGARVIKIERPESGDFARDYDHVVDGLSSAFLWLNRGKESIELDIKSVEGRRVLDALLLEADVFMHNISPDAAKRLGLDSTTLKRSFPHLICGSVSGYGVSGPMALSKAYDLLVQGETGMISLSGGEEAPAKVGVSIADISAGMYAYASILAAVRQRDRTGEVLTVDVSLFDSLTEWLGYPLLYAKHGGEPPRRMGTSHATIAPYGAFASEDGSPVLLAVQNQREWARFCADVMDASELEHDPRFATNADRVRNCADLTELVNGRLGRLDRATVIGRLEAAGIANARLNDLKDLEHHVQLTDRDRWVTTPTEVGSVRTVKPPWAPDGHHGDYGATPSLGEHTQQILTWLALKHPDAKLARLAPKES